MKTEAHSFDISGEPADRYLAKGTTGIFGASMSHISSVQTIPPVHANFGGKQTDSSPTLSQPYHYQSNYSLLGSIAQEPIYGLGVRHEKTQSSMIPLGLQGLKPYENNIATTFEMQSRGLDEPYRYSHRSLVAGDLSSQVTGTYQNHHNDADTIGGQSKIHQSDSDCLNQFLDTYNLEGSGAPLPQPQIENSQQQEQQQQYLLQSASYFTEVPKV